MLITPLPAGNRWICTLPATLATRPPRHQSAAVTDEQRLLGNDTQQGVDAAESRKTGHQGRRHDHGP
jgi:hypothetical protein